MFWLSGHRRDFLLPDRSKYVNMEKRFLRSYMDLLVQTCHRRGALATGGMVALLLPQDVGSDSYRSALATVARLEHRFRPQISTFFFLSLTYIHIIHHISVEIIILVILMTNENVHCSKIHICMYLKYTTVLRWKSLQSLEDSSYVFNNNTSIRSSVDFEAEACGSWLYFPPSTG